MFLICLCYSVVSVPCTPVITCCENSNDWPLSPLVCDVSLLFLSLSPYGVSGNVCFLIIHVPQSWSWPLLYYAYGHNKVPHAFRRTTRHLSKIILLSSQSKITLVTIFILKNRYIIIIFCDWPLEALRANWNLSGKLSIKMDIEYNQNFGVNLIFISSSKLYKQTEHMYISWAAKQRLKPAGSQIYM